MPHNTSSLLDVEDDNDREQRIRRLLEHTDAIGTASSHPRSLAAGSSSNFDFGIHETHAVEPPTQLLQRIQQFLPQMEASNADLVRRARNAPESVDIEHLDLERAGGQYIEMNLGLGVFDIRRPGSERSPSSGSGNHNHGSHSSAKTDSDSASDSDSDDDCSTSSSSSSSSDSHANDASADSMFGSEPESRSADHGGAGTDNVDGFAGVFDLSQRPVRPLPNRARPSIVVLGETSHNLHEKKQSS